MARPRHAHALVLLALVSLLSCSAPTTTDAGSADGGSSSTGGGSTSSGGGTGGVGGGGGGGNTGGFGSGADPIVDPSGNPTSYELIDQAVAAKTLSEEQGALYKLYADFAAAELPAPYRGDDDGLVETFGAEQFVAYVAKVGAANVSSATLEAAHPYFVPAYFEGSWWNRAHPNATKSPSNPTCRAWQAPCSPLKEWRNLKGTNVVVWYETANETSDGPKAATLLAELDTVIYPKLTTLMGRAPLSDVSTGLVSETDPRLDVILTDELPASVEGRTLTLGFECKAAPSHIYLRRSLPMHGLLAQAAHEVMHAIQYAIPVKASCTSSYATLLDATAVWATNFYDAKNDWEHKYAKFYLEGDNVTLPYDSMPTIQFAYGAYLFPLFLETKFGPAVVKLMWDATTTTSTELGAIDVALIGLGSRFEKVWPEFVAANWNQDTIATYRQVDHITTVAQLDAARDQVLTTNGGVALLEHNASVAHAAASYYRVKVTDPDARSLSILNGWAYQRTTKDPGFGPVVSFKGLSALDRQGAAMQVFFKVNGAWQPKPVDLTNAAWVSMCRDNPLGQVEEMVFMYSNAEISESAPNYSALTARGSPPAVLATSIGCRDWVGELSMTSTTASTTEKLKISNATLQNALNTDAPQPGGMIPYVATAGQEIPMGYGYPYAVQNGSVTWSYSSSSSSCTRTGNSTLTLSAGNPVHLFSNFTPSGKAALGLSFTGFLGLSNMFTVNWSCTDSQGKVTTGTELHASPLDVAFAFDAPPRIAPSGLSVSGTQAQTKDAKNTVGTWSLTGSK